MHALMFDGRDPRGHRAAVFRWREAVPRAHLRAEEYRGQSIGDLMTRLMILRGFDFAKEIYLHAQLQAQGFYERYGFRAEGEPFLEEGQEHVLMRLKKEETRFPSKCGEDCAKNTIH